MPTMTRDNSETSVTFSLAELARIEEDRVRDEDQRRARSRETAARERREAEAQRRAAEEAAVAAQAEARARRQREEAEEAMRKKAREQAEVEVARIAAAARARLDAENAARAHELAVMRVNGESGSRRLKVALAAVLGLVICGGPAAAYGVHRQVTTLEHDNAQLRDSQSALAQERDHAKTAELATLDRRHVALRARPLGREDARATEEARATVEAARNAIDLKALDHSRLRAFGEALDVLETKIETLEKLAALDRRHADLVAWADQRKMSDAAAAARSAAARTKVMPDEGAVRAWDTALDQLRDSLANAKGAASGGAVAQPVGSRYKCNGPGDPMCDGNGNVL